MKKELKEIINSNDSGKLKDYILLDKPLDYSFSSKLGDSREGLNTIFYVLYEKKFELADVILKHANPLYLKDTLNSFQSWHNHPALDVILATFLNKTVNPSIKNTIYNFFNQDSKSKISSKLEAYLSNPKYQDPSLLKYLSPRESLKMIIQNDDANSLLEFIEKNPKYISNAKENYLLKSIENQSVFCFDIIKDHLKSVKLEQSNKLKRNTP